MNTKAPSPLFIGVVCGTGTVLALSIVLMFLSAGMPQALYDVAALSRAISAGKWLHPIFTLVSVVGYLEAGFIYMLFKRRQAPPPLNITLVDVVGQARTAPSRPPAVAGAGVGALTAVVGLGVAIPLLVVMTYLTLQDRNINMPPTLMTQVLVGSAIMGVVNRGIGMILGTIGGALGGFLGGMLPQQAATPQVS